jgi:hypothetical protein
MSNIAICFSGLPRSIDKSFDNIQKNLIEPNKPDVFIHSWTEDEEIKSEIIQKYQPKSYVFESRKNFVNDDLDLDRMMISHARSYTRLNFVDMLYSSWYSIQQSNNIKELYRLSNGINYDYVIRARFDLNYSQIIDCKNYDNNKIYVSNRQLPDHDMIDDMFSFGSNQNMNVYSSSFNYLDFFCNVRSKIDGIFCGETLVYETLKTNNIEYKIIEDLNTNKVW